MYEIINYNTDEEWLKVRQQGIGGSDVAILLGGSTYMSPLELWRDKRIGLGLSNEPFVFKPKEITICSERGKAMESVALGGYERKEKCKVTNIDGVLRSKEYPFMQASLDGYLKNENKLVEIKTVNIYAQKEWGDPDAEQIPPNYYLQVQHYLIVTGFKVCDVAVLFMSKDDIQIFTIQADLETQKMIIEHEQQFWSDVNNDRPPAAESRDISITYPKSNGKAIEVNPVIKCNYQHLLAIQAELKKLKKQKAELEDQIQLFLGSDDTLMDGKNILVTWKNDKAGKELNEEALKQAHPDIYKEFTVEKEGSRRFLIKGVED